MSAVAHPIQLVVTDDLRRSRLTVFFRYLLALPHMVWLALYGIAAYVALFIAWFVAVFTGRVPAGLHAFLAGFVSYQTRVNAYMYLVTNQFPPFGSGGEYAISLEVAGPERQSRLGVFFRGLLVLPALALSGVLGYALGLAAFAVWFYALWHGRTSEGLRDLGVYSLRFQQRTVGYYLLLTSRYPALGRITM